MSEAYRPNADSGLRYNDPAFDFRWPNEPKLISAKDIAYPDFDHTKLMRT
jgi:dTDP-4-dehydrorhamnose 3,5-epimerase